MIATLAPYIVEGIIILACAVFGFLLEKKGKPYGKVKLISHLFFFLWFSLGYYFIVSWNNRSDVLSPDPCDRDGRCIAVSSLGES